MLHLKKNNGSTDSQFTVGSNYPFICFEYIHKNPSEADLVKNNLD